MLIQTLVTMLASTQISASQGYLGVNLAETNGRLAVQQIEADSPAIRVLRAGDVILEIAGIPVTTRRGFDAVMSRTQPGERITMLVESNGASSSHDIVLAAPASASGRASGGDVKVTYSAEQDLPSMAKLQLVLSAQGPGAGEFGISIGAAYSDLRPFIDFRYVHGLGDPVSFELELQTYVLQNHMDVGLRFHLVRGDYFSFALRARVHEEHFLEGDDLFLLSASPGILMSFGGQRMQFTIGTDADIFLFTALEGFDPSFDFIAFGFRPHIGFEFALTDSMNILAEARIQTFKIEGFDPIIEPGVSIGLAW
jgi:hypothetical protein